MMNGGKNLKNKEGGRHKKRRIAALLIVAVLLVGVVPLAAFAQDDAALPLAEEAVLGQSPAAAPPEATPQNADGQTSNTPAPPMSAQAYGAAAPQAGAAGTKAVVDAPTGLVSDPVSGNYAAVRLTWAASATPDVIYRIYGGTSPYGPFNVAVTTEGTTATLTGLTPNRTYYYFVVAYLDPDESDPSNTVSFRAVQPLYVTVTPSGANSLNVSWTSITGATSYDVYRSGDGVNFTLSSTTSRTNFQDTGLIADTQYWYKIVANNGPEGTGTGKTDAKPQAPFNLRVTGYGDYNNNANLSWSASAGADGYYIYRSTDRDFGYILVGNSAGAATYNDIGLSYNTTYYYYVTAVKNGVESDPSNIGSLTTRAPILVVNVSNPTASSLNVSWNPIPGAGSYTLYRSIDGVNYEQIRVSYTTSYADAGLQANTQYWYKVVSDNGIEGTDFGWTLPDPKPDAPLNLNAELTGAYRLDARLTWDPVAGADGYTIYRSTMQFGTYSQIGTTQSGVTEYLDAGLDFNTTYYYKVTAVKDSQQSDPSNIDSVTTSRPVLNVAVSNPTANSLDVSWNVVPRATSYTVYRSLDGVDYSTLVGTYQGTGFTDTGRNPDTDHWYKVVSNNRIEGTGSGKTLPVPAETYTVTFDGNGATTPADPVRLTVTTPQTHLSSLPAPPQRTGCSFAGWYTQKTGGAEFTAETAVTGDMTVYAQWTAVYYRLYFDLNGGSGAAPQAQSLRMDALARPVENPERSGYTFLGWNVSSDGTGAWWDFGTTLMPAADVTLYAQWRQDDAPPAPSQNTGGETASPGGPKTGDETNMALWIVLIIAAAGVIAGVMVYRYRKAGRRQK